MENFNLNNENLNPIYKNQNEITNNEDNYKFFENLPEEQLFERMLQKTLFGKKYEENLKEKSLADNNSIARAEIDSVTGENLLEDYSNYLNSNTNKFDSNYFNEFENLTNKSQHKKVLEQIFKKENEENLKEEGLTNNNSIFEENKDDEFNDTEIINNVDNLNVIKEENEDNKLESTIYNDENNESEINSSEININKNKKKKKKTLTRTQRKQALNKAKKEKEALEKKRKEEKTRNKIQETENKKQEYIDKDKEKMTKIKKLNFIDDIREKMSKEIKNEKDLLMNLFKYESENKSSKELIDLMTEKSTVDNILSVDDESEIRKIAFYNFYADDIRKLQNSPTYKKKLEEFKRKNLPLKVLFNLVLKDFKEVCEKEHKEDYAEYLKFVENEKSKLTEKNKPYDEYSDSYNLLLLLQEIIFKKLTNCEMKMTSAEQRYKVLNIMRSSNNYKKLAKRFEDKVNIKFTDFIYETNMNKKMKKLKQFVQKDPKYFMNTTIKILNE